MSKIINNNVKKKGMKHYNVINSYGFKDFAQKVDPLKIS